MEDKATLPPLPGSDPQSLQWNKKDNFYQVGAREYWGQNEIYSNKLEDFKKCEHYFELLKGVYKCKQCNFCLQNSPLYILTLKDGILSNEGLPIFG